MDIFEFPIDLKNVISAFAYDCKWETVEKDLITCEEVQKMNISPVFLRKMMWSTKYTDYICFHWVRPGPCRTVLELRFYYTVHILLIRPDSWEYYCALNKEKHL